MGKEKKRKNKIRKLVRAFSAGGAVFKVVENSDPLWLIIKPSGTNRWQLPKGTIEKGESSGEAATREVEEEGGVKVKTIQKIDDIKYFFVMDGKKYFKTVNYFLMEYLENKDEGHDSEVEEAKFFTSEKALMSLTFKDEKAILMKAEKLLNSLK